MELTQKVNRETKVQSVLTLIITKDSLKPSSCTAVLKSCSHWSQQWYQYTTARLLGSVCWENVTASAGGVCVCFAIGSPFYTCLAIRFPVISRLLMLSTTPFISPLCSDSQVCQCHFVCPTLWPLPFSGCGRYLCILISIWLGCDLYG